MKKMFLFFVLIMAIAACTKQSNLIHIKNVSELQEAVQMAAAGDELVLADGVYKDVQLKIVAKGTADQPVIIRAEHPGKVSFEGLSNIKLGGTYITIKDIQFKNGHTPDNAVILFKVDDGHIANHCRVTGCIIENYNQPHRYDSDHWVEFWGRHNQLDHCYIAGKSNNGPTLRVFLKGNEHIRNYHQITNNYFGPRPRKGGPHGETIQIGDSYTSMTPSYVIVKDNYFERCNGEVEVISSKSNFNEFRNNIFYECEGSLVMRHGNYCQIDGNIFIGNPKSNFNGGIRVINTGHWITNNYFYRLQADEFRAPLAIMNGIPKSPLNRYNQVTDVVVAYNTWVDCRSPWQISVGANMNKKDVLPKSEIRSARPRRVLLANNLIFNHQADVLPIKHYDAVDGITFKNNVIHNGDKQFGYKGFRNSALQLNKQSEWLYTPAGHTSEMAEVYNGFDFEQIHKDLFGNDRTKQNSVGAIAGSVTQNLSHIDKNNYGPDWFTTQTATAKPTTHTVKKDVESLVQTIQNAAPGDIVKLEAGTYQINTSLMINKDITLKAADTSDLVTLKYAGPAGKSLFELHPYANLNLQHITLDGNRMAIAFAPLEQNMSAAYRLKVNNCSIVNFKQVLKAFRGSMADSILIAETSFKACDRGIVLAAETDDKGDYNAEFLTISGCTFENIKQDVLNYYRGGYDESTIGGNLIVENSSFKNCGRNEPSKILLKTRGIINVRIAGNTFKNNPVKLVVLLWGEKNNVYQENTISNSGRIRVDKYLKQKLMY